MQLKYTETESTVQNSNYVDYIYSEICSMQIIVNLISLKVNTSESKPLTRYKYHTNI